VLRAFLVTALLAIASGCGNAPSKGECEKLLEHLVELEAAAGGAAAAADPKAPKGELEQQKKKVRESVGLDFCLKDLSKDQLECGLKARSLEELKTCEKS
jgi:hypothetical protein